MACTVPDEEGIQAGVNLRIDTGHQELQVPLPDGLKPGDKFKVTSDGFIDGVIHILAQRAGASDANLLNQEKRELADSVAALSQDHLRSLTDGAVFVLCGESVADDANFIRLADILQLSDEQIVPADKAGYIMSGQDALRHKTAALNGLDNFLQSNRGSGDHLDR